MYFCFTKNVFFAILNGIWDVWGCPGGMVWTIRCDSLELWPGLVLHGMGDVAFHVFWKYGKLTSSPNTSKLVLGPPGWSSEFFERQGTISVIWHQHETLNNVFLLSGGRHLGGSCRDLSRILLRALENTNLVVVVHSIKILLGFYKCKPCQSFILSNSAKILLTFC